MLAARASRYKDLTDGTEMPQSDGEILLMIQPSDEDPEHDDSKFVGQNTHADSL
jgi:hypothetical protein